MGNTNSQNDRDGIRVGLGKPQRVPSLLSSRRSSRSLPSSPVNAQSSSTSTANTNLNLDHPLPPPPYSPVDDNATSTLAPPVSTGHRRTVSASAHSSRPPTTSPAIPRHRTSHGNVAAGVGGFRAEMPAGSSHTVVTVTPPAAANTSTRTSTGSSARPPVRRRSTENALELLRKFNVVVIVDDSGSMAGGLWREAGVALAGIAGSAAKYDTDGIDIYFLNSPRVGTNIRTSAAVEAIFAAVDPRGPTPLGFRLEQLLQQYISSLERAKDAADQGDSTALNAIKPINIIVITDGVPTDDPESVIVAAARRLDARNFPLSQCGIQFVQIGSDPEAALALQELDDGLSQTHHIRDMVDTTPYTADGSRLTTEKIIKILLGGINRRVDTRGGAAVM